MRIAIRNISVTVAAMCIGLSVPRAADALKPAPDPLAAQEARLDAALKDLDPQAAPADLAPVARARIQEARALLQDDPKSEKAPGWIMACSLMTEAAVTQVRGQQAGIERIRLQDERIKAQSELVATQDEIFKLERGYASSLKADLDEQRKKAAAAKDDAEKRASNVMDFLVTPGGIAATRLTSMGYGFTKPIADNATKEGRQKNRRVDLVIMDKKAP